MLAADARRIALELLALRAPTATVCPSEVARAVVKTAGGEAAPASWRSAMPIVHTAIDELWAEGLVQLSWKGKKVAKRKGPYRIGRST